ncbi:prepilin-type N-terminal cleavage/methylation domain-containing protein [Acetivibrio clariflavus]|uniref:Prepilin-type N-terminal cleavage/methylation domain-containing protein n=1 Tax=Acetivibrio clariflavus (strain DSM 19732 / NBRC 101661 / EBR45) TaxID=720554 RepID=G8LXM9_ACECE|nr:prepilin-type N-terminal cleavage/methylation domain-containing protein [Acetivibrio clariflavus]AEV67740.1 prepilin-type N-terminal cleavage/methylation domain-containing protein [Acetivibrio clariflavus DSM 19732]
MVRFPKNNKGFSLIELLIVIAILGVIAVITITMFTNVISNSRKKSDEQQALLIEKAVISYMMQSSDYKLEHLKYDGAVHSMDGKPSEELIYALQNTIICTLDGSEKEIYPILNPKSSSIPSTSDYTPFWNTSNGGKYIGYKIEVYSENLSCNVTPVTADANIHVY